MTIAKYRSEKVRPEIPTHSMPSHAPGTPAAVMAEIRRQMLETFQTPQVMNTKENRESCLEAIKSALRNTMPAGVAVHKVSVSDTGIVDIEIAAPAMQMFRIDLELSNPNPPYKEPEITFLTDLKEL